MIAGLEITSFIYFMFWAWLGQIYIVLVQIKKNSEIIHNQGGFAPAYWWKTNRKRVLITLVMAMMLSPLAVLIAIEAPGIVTEVACFGTGAVIDKTVEAFTNKRK